MWQFYVSSVYLPATTQSYDLFLYHVEFLFELSSVYQEKGTFILIGDFNLKISGPRRQHYESDRSNLCLWHVLCEYGPFMFRSIDIFQSYKGGPATCIDHILLNRKLLSSIRYAEVLDEHSFDLSDHYPVICSINADTHPTITRGESYTSTVSWDKARSDGKISDYPFALSQNLWSLKQPACVTKLNVTTTIF